MSTRVCLKIYGTVQGVNFRTSAKARAEELHLSGFVRNERDGSVYAEAEGNKEHVEQFRAWCRHGPSKAIVESVIEESHHVQHTEGFEIRKG